LYDTCKGVHSGTCTTRVSVVVDVQIGPVNSTCWDYENESETARTTTLDTPPNITYTDNQIPVTFCTSYHAANGWSRWI